MEEENINLSPMIAIKLIDGTVIYAQNFRVALDTIYVSDVKYGGPDEPPMFIEDSMLINKASVETYAIIHIGGEENEEVSENRDGSPTSTQHLQ